MMTFTVPQDAGEAEDKVRIRKSTLKRIISEAIAADAIDALVKKHASAAVSIDDAVKAAMADKPDVDRAALEDAMEDYYDEMSGF